VGETPAIELETAGTWAADTWSDEMPKLAGYGSFATLPEERVTDKISRRQVAGEQGMIVWWSMKAGAHAAAHKHPHEQIFWMLKGKMEFRLGNERRICGPGDVAVIPGGVEHEAWFHEDTEVIDVFAPPREDFLAGGPPAYMRAS
jgi:quercetin dioxygenase-like cupin family protein